MKIIKVEKTPYYINLNSFYDEKTILDTIDEYFELIEVGDLNDPEVFKNYFSFWNPINLSYVGDKFILIYQHLYCNLDDKLGYSYLGLQLAFGKRVADELYIIKMENGKMVNSNYADIKYYLLDHFMPYSILLEPNGTKRLLRNRTSGEIDIMNRRKEKMSSHEIRIGNYVAILLFGETGEENKVATEILKRVESQELETSEEIKNLVVYGEVFVLLYNLTDKHYMNPHLVSIDEKLSDLLIDTLLNYNSSMERAVEYETIPPTFDAQLKKLAIQQNVSQNI